MSQTFSQITEKYKLKKLFDKKISLSSDAKKISYKLTVLSVIYALINLKEIKNNKEINKSDIDKIYDTLINN